MVEVKSETRNSKFETHPKQPMSETKTGLRRGRSARFLLVLAVCLFVSDFGFRISNFQGGDCSIYRTNLQYHA